jgi:hypothetical protein
MMRARSRVRRDGNALHAWIRAPERDCWPVLPTPVKSSQYAELSYPLLSVARGCAQPHA